jgi:signal transduction histidine kinase
MVMAVAVAATTITLHVVNGPSPLTSWWYGNSVFAVALTAPGALIVRYRPANSIGWLMCLAGLSEGICGAGREYLVFGALGHTAPGALWVGWFCDSLYTVAMATLPVMLVVFPTGRPANPGWRWVPRLMATAVAVGVPGFLLTGDGVVQLRGRSIHNPAAGVLPGALTTSMAVTAQLLLVGGILAGFPAIVLRYRAASGAERQQLKWVAWSGSIMVVELISEVTINPIAPITGSLVTMVLAASVAIAVLRHRLLDIDVVIARTLIFIALTVLVGGGYVGVVLLIGLLVGEPSNFGAPLIATAVVALGFAPVRQLVQRRVERLVYGDRSNPYTVVTTLGRQLERTDPNTDVAALLSTVAQALKLPYVALMDATGELVAAVGTATAEVVRQELRYGGAEIGALLLGVRNGSRSLDRKELQLVEDLAPHIAAAVHAMTLAGDLQRSRQRLVTAKEEERRRLRRDLHDGVGPRLAALGLKLDAARLMVDGRPQDAAALIGAVKGDIRSTLEDIRRLVYNLRPPALDELGLTGALRERADELDSSEAGGGVRFLVDGPDEIAALPAATEVAAFWIATEAMTNVVRHANARQCEVRLRVGAELEIDVVDDGAGLVGEWRPGIGTSSMAERASELGGCCTISPGGGGGVRVSARLPLDEAGVRL